MSANKKISKFSKFKESLGIWSYPRFGKPAQPSPPAVSPESHPNLHAASPQGLPAQPDHFPSHPSPQVPVIQQVEQAAQDPQQPQRAKQDPNQEWVRLRKPWPIAARISLVAIIAVVLVASVALVATSWVSNQIDPPGPPGAEILVEIPVGASTNDIAIILDNEGVVPNSTFARLQWRGEERFKFKAGEYVFRENMSIDEAEAVLLAGPVATPGISITVPEGLWLSEIRARMLDRLPEFNSTELSTALNANLVRSEFQPAEINSLEGLLFPDTYQVAEEDLDNEVDLVRRMVEQMDSVLVELGYEQAMEQTGFSPYEVLIVASMIEEEAKVAQDRAKIARVIYNRLEQDIALGIDATVLYALGRHTTELTNQDLAIDSPYNTRLYKGLPPTPIAAPGRKALEAALNPAEGDWIFYVLADDDGSHFFTDSQEEFLEQVEKSRREGIF